MELIKIVAVMDKKFIELLIPSLNMMAIDLKKARETNLSLRPSEHRDIIGHLQQLEELQKVLSYQLDAYERSKLKPTNTASNSKWSSKLRWIKNRILGRK